MKTRDAVVVAFAAGALVVGAIGAGEAPERAKPVSLEELHARGVEGRLGVRLGTLVEVSGEVVANTTQRKADVGIPFFLRIDAVNGKPLATPAQFPFTRHALIKAKELPQPKIGDRLDIGPIVRRLARRLTRGQRGAKRTRYNAPEIDHGGFGGGSIHVARWPVHRAGLATFHGISHAVLAIRQ